MMYPIPYLFVTATHGVFFFVSSFCGVQQKNSLAPQNHKCSITHNKYNIDVSVARKVLA